jgi:nucleoside-diphosphate-sugar epimerase
MKVLVLGASGATGKLVVGQLLNVGQFVKIIIRPTSIIPVSWKEEVNLEIKVGYIDSMPTDELKEIIKDCHSIISCLGHNLTWQGVFGKPRKLVTKSVVNVCNAIDELKTDQLFKIILMNTAGNQNRDMPEIISVKEKLALGLIRLILPPHRDNETASDYLRVIIGQTSTNIEWVVVRPDTLIDRNQVTQYTDHPSPIRSAIFNPGKTSRITVADFMVRLIVEIELWKQWKGKMPVLYNVK